MSLGYWKPPADVRFHNSSHVGEFKPEDSNDDSEYDGNPLYAKNWIEI